MNNVRQPNLFVPTTGIPLLHLRRVLELPELRGRVGVYLTGPTIARYGVTECAQLLGLHDPHPTPDATRVLAHVNRPHDEEERAEVEDLLGCMRDTLPTLDGILLQIGVVPAYEDVQYAWAKAQQARLDAQKPMGPTLYVPTSWGNTNWWQYTDHEEPSQTSAMLSGLAVVTRLWPESAYAPGDNRVFQRLYSYLSTLFQDRDPSRHSLVLDARSLFGKDPSDLARIVLGARRQIDEAAASADP